MTTRALVAVGLTASFIAACGSETPTKAPDQADVKKAMLGYAKCMREHGVDMPDPVFEGNRIKQTGPPNVSRAKTRAAVKACASIRDAVKPPAMSDEDRAAFKRAALKNAQCMRDHGLANFPDPVFDSSGGAQIRMKKGSGLDPESPRFKRAMKACENTLPQEDR